MPSARRKRGKLMALVALMASLLSAQVVWAQATPAAKAGEQASPAAPTKRADEALERPTIQRRFAPKDKLLFGNASIMKHVRDDFYSSWGYGADVGFFVAEQWGLELRYLKLNTSLDDSAVDLKERIGLTPDARPQGHWLQLGARYAPGYGKLLMWESLVLHFDPQIVVHGGVALAEARVLPSFNVALSLLGHFRWGLKLKVDLGASVQGEHRERGWIWTLGFAPVLGLGWGYNF